MVNEPFREQEGGFSLVDYLTIIIKRWKLCVLVALSFVVLGAIQWAARPEIPFPYQTVIEVGAKTDALPLEDTRTVKSKLVDAFIPLVLRDFAAKSGAEDAGVRVDVEFPEESRAVILKSYGSKADEGMITGVQQSVANLLIADHQKKAISVADDLRRQKFEAGLALEEIKEEREALKKSEEALAVKVNLAKSQLVSITDLVKSLEKDRSSALSRSGGAASGSLAAGIILIDNSIAQYRDQMRRMEDRVYIDLVSERASIEKAKVKNTQDQHRQEELIHKLEKDLLQPYGSRILLPPTRLLRASKPGPVQTLVIFGAIGVIASLFLAALLEFVVRAYEQTGSKRSVNRPITVNTPTAPLRPIERVVETTQPEIHHRNLNDHMGYRQPPHDPFKNI